MSNVEQFETKWAEFTHTKYAIAHNSGTSGLHTALMAGSIKGTEVIVPALMPIMPAFAAVYAGAIPVFADIDPETFNISEDDVISKITENTSAVIVVHLYGLRAKMDRIVEVCNQKGIVVIEDSAECVLSDQPLQGDMAVYSFERTKHLTTGEGGMVVTNDEGFGEWVRKFGGIGYKHLTAGHGKTSADSSVFQNPNYKRHDTVGYNYRMSEPCAELGLKGMETLPQKIELRQQIGKMYLDAIKDCKWIVPQKIPEGFEHSYFAFACYLNTMIEWQEFYNTYRILANDTFYAAWSLSYREPALMYIRASCINAEKLQPRMMQFKTNQKSIEEAKPLVEALYKTIRIFE